MSQIRNKLTWQMIGGFATTLIAIYVFFIKYFPPEYENKQTTAEIIRDNRLELVEEKIKDSRKYNEEQFKEIKAELGKILKKIENPEK